MTYKNLAAAVQTSDAILMARLQGIFAADQSNRNRSKASALYAELQSMRDEYLGTNVEPDYHNALSLEVFHMGQTDCLDRDNVAAGRKNFQLALGHAEDQIKAVERIWGTVHMSYTWWRDYVAFTIAYLDNDVSEARRLAELAKCSDKTIPRMLAGLVAHGGPDYKRDYMGPKKVESDE